ncbi:MAG TPA: hypothetical protein VFA11_00040 [Acidimicrobiales bacterium]|nr:hypothetical protein [Acidimicrobiales bacterium]
MPANERLRAAILRSGRSLDQLAHDLGVDPKTIERWIAGRIPYKRHQYALADLLSADPAYLWPTGSPAEASGLAMAEILAVYPIRSMAGNDLWRDLFASADSEIDVLVYAGFWLSEDPGIRRVLARKASSGVRLRFLFGDTGGAQVSQRGADEGIGAAIAAKIENTIHNYHEVFKLPGVEVRLHDTVLCNSIYRADQEMLVNTHLYGLPGHMTPLLHLRRLPEGEFFAGYRESFERVWAGAKPLDRSEEVA